MTLTSVGRRVTTFLFAIAVLIQLTPVVAIGQSKASENRRGPVDVTFKKWRTAVLPATVPGATTRILFKGVVGGELGDGDFVAEVLDRQVTTPCSAFAPAPCPPVPSPSIIALDAVYEIHAGDRSFTALLHGGTNGATGAALLEGLVVAGWRTGAHVRVAFDTVSNCAEANGGTCFQGVVRVGAAH